MKILVTPWISLSFTAKKFMGWGLDIPNSNSKEKLRDHVPSKVSSSKVIIIWLLQASTALK